MTKKRLERPDEFKRFQRYETDLALTRHFPNCPEQHRALILTKILDRDWDKKTSLIQAVSIVVHNHIRHHLTDYDHWIGQHGITRDEARIVVKPEVSDWFDYWHSGEDIYKPEPSR